MHSSKSVLTSTTHSPNPVRATRRVTPVHARACKFVCAWQVFAFDLGKTPKACADYLQVNGESFCGEGTESGPADVVPDGA